MEKLLSSIIAGERKGDISEDIKGKKLKVKFLGYTEDGKAKILLGNKVIVADVETDRQFIEGEELIFLVKSLYPRLELKLIKLDENWCNQFILLKLLPFLDSESIKKVLSHIIKKQFKNLSENENENLKNFINFVFSAHGAEDGLSAVRDIIIQSKGKLSQEDFKKLILSILAFYFLPVGNVVFFPIKIKDTDVEIIFEKEDEGCRIEAEISKENLILSISVFIISNEVSVEFKTENEKVLNSLKIENNKLKEKLLSAGFIPISITYKKEKIEKGKLLEKIKIKTASGKINISV